MRVLIAHNFYQQAGGEDQVFRTDLALLKAHGHEPVAFEMHNDAVEQLGRLKLAAATVWNRDSARQFGGIPADRIFAKPNFVDPDPGLRGGPRAGAEYAILVGRLSHEKGLDVLLKAWQDPSLPRLKIVGDGPLAEQVKAAVASNPAIEW